MTSSRTKTATSTSSTRRTTGTTPEPPAPWPSTTKTISASTATASAEHAGDLAVGGVPLAQIAATYGTPVYVLDEADVRGRARAYRAALPDAEIANAG